MIHLSRHEPGPQPVLPTHVDGSPSSRLRGGILVPVNLANGPLGKLLILPPLWPACGQIRVLAFLTDQPSFSPSYSVPLGPSEYFTIVVASKMAAVAGVGVPGSSSVTTLIVLGAIGMGPKAAAGIALVVGLDRFLDMFRTGTNVLGDLTCTALVAKVEGEEIQA